MRENLTKSLGLMFGHEGGLSLSKADKGNYMNGELVGTKYGITGATLAAHRGVRHVSQQDVRNLTLGEAEEIYRKSYWVQSGGDLLPTGLDFAAFDFGVNSGPNRAIKTLQQVLGFKGKDVDGIAGVKTADAAKKWRGGLVQLIEEYQAARLAFMKGLSNWPKFKGGWTIRVAEVEQQAVTMVMGGMPTVEEPAAVSPKAPPEDEKARRDPATWLQAAPVLGGLGFLFEGDGPAQWAVGAVMVMAGAAALYYIIRRIRSTPA